MEVARSTDTHCIRHDDCVRVKNNDRVINFVFFVLFCGVASFCEFRLLKVYFRLRDSRWFTVPKKS